MSKEDWEVKPFPTKQNLSESSKPTDVILPPKRNSQIEKTDEGFLSNAERVEYLINKISKELKIAHSQKYDATQAELTAALVLDAQKELSEFLSDAELISKEKKAEVERVEAERYYFYKENSESKTSDVALTRLVSKDELVLTAKKEQYSAESDFSKYKNLFGMLKDAHVFFRGLAKGKNDWT